MIVPAVASALQGTPLLLPRLRPDPAYEQQLQKQKQLLVKKTIEPSFPVERHCFLWSYQSVTF
jgi:hypothetical protein